MKNAWRLLLGCFFLLMFMGALEIAYRINLYLKHPNNFQFSKANENSTMFIFDKPQWEYDSRFGYSYPPVNISTTIIENGVVTKCLEDTFTNIQGNIGPVVADFNQAKNRILILGDSFTAHALDGETWPNLLSNILNHSKNNNVRVMNLARDGYGLMQMFDLAAVKIPELKPTLVVFAFNSTAIARARTWRVKVGEGDQARLLTTIENSTNPHSETSLDMETLMPSASKEWCNTMLSKSADKQHNDPLLKTAINKTLRIRQQNGDFSKANIWDLSSSYIYHLLVHKDPFFGQRHKVSPVADPKLTYNDFRNDPEFLKTLAFIQAEGVPFVFVHLPLGISIKDHQEFYLDEQGQALKRSLEEVTGHNVVSMHSYLSIKDDEGMKLCMSPDNCHPSQFGMQIYADSIAKILTPLLKQDNHS